MIGITNTTGNMGKLEKYLRNNGKEHGYCTDHNLHLVALLAFDRECDLCALLHCFFCCVIIYDHLETLCLVALNVPTVAVAMKKARDIVHYFNKSTQASKKLKDQHKESSLAKYSGQPKNILQDVKTRWWSRWSMCCMLKRL
jgi:hypothetical protein